MLTSTEAIVLCTRRYGERRLLVTLFTRSAGTGTFVYAMPSRGRAGNKANLFTPLNLLDITYDASSRSSMPRLSSVSLSTALHTIPLSSPKIALTLFLADILRYALSHELANAPLFVFITNSITFLDQATHPTAIANFHLTFLAQLMFFLGIAPNLDDYSPSAYYDLDDNTFCDAPPMTHRCLTPDTAAFIPILFRMTYRNMHRVRLSHHQRNDIIQTILLFFTIHLPAFPEIRSLEVLQEISRSAE